MTSRIASPDPQPQGHRPASAPADHPGGSGRTARPASRGGRALRRIAPAVGLFFLAPLIAEYLLGNIPTSEIAGALLLAPMYGGGAVLIREAARRTGRGWPTVILLASAYGVLEAGLLDQSLFNPSFEGYDFQGAAHIPVLGISAHYVLTFVGGHAIWSIGVPIAVVETLVPRRSTTPWLGGSGLAVTCLLFVSGSAVIFYGISEDERFLASASQVIGAAAVIAILIGTAFAVGRRPRPRIDRRAPDPWLVGTVALAVSGLFFVRPESWPGTALGVALIALMTTVVARWSRRAGWAASHRLALAGGALLTYVWAGFLLLSLENSASTANLIGQAILALGAVVLLAVAARRTRRTWTAAP
ncbi:hypothetical protein FHR32_000365 [Streptosporangium album]|uniref:DUF998 domain-containing protein n=1 Tax=Streptosporangium album TaxID=47479 RepID=A0A7W7W7L5_9ACTN|nr:hypothetical protein [Streptosporangium album]MBB4936060.1 hypothetical protein [Streptosporangium album]